MISVIDMPPPAESSWWRGKKGFEVGFFPSECVEVIGDKIPHSFKLSNSSTKPVFRRHGKLIAFFRSFLLSRPSRRKLKQSGILKERVFGCDLGEHLLNTGRDIPMVLKCCAEFIEEYGIVDGIYRLSGVSSNIQRLRLAFDEDRPINLGDPATVHDIHSVASLLKMYFRELPNPLLTYQLYDKFVSAMQCNEDVRLLKVRDVVQQLPPPHFRTLQYLLSHLARVASHGEETGMTPKNIAIVWAPNLLRSRDVENGGVGALHVVGVQAVLTEYLIRFSDLIFDDKGSLLSSSEQEGLLRARPKSLAISTPTKLLSLEEARARALSTHLPSSQQKYIEVGGGPDKLPSKYHTVIELPSG
ncbi:GTPase-activating protein CdGAPr, partial [Trichonephila clavata]